MDGIINIYKEAGFTSHDVVAKLRGILKQKKIGHTGTLDPAATGVLPVCLGKATRLCDLLTDKDKTYLATLKLGVETDTQDMTGTVIKETPAAWEEENIRAVMASFVGKQEQIPPMYSALKVNGKKLYELAREGKEVERKARPIEIFSLEIRSMNEEQREITFTVHCSKGTYIRTLCADMGQKLGCGGCMKSLQRTQVERFLLEDSLTLSQVEELFRAGELEPRLVTIEEMFAAYSKISTKEKADRLLYNGNALSVGSVVTEKAASEEWQDDSIWRAYDSQGSFKGLYQYKGKDSGFKPYKMFL